MVTTAIPITGLINACLYSLRHYRNSGDWAWWLLSPRAGGRHAADFARAAEIEETGPRA